MFIWHVSVEWLSAALQIENKKKKKKSILKIQAFQKF